MIPIIQKRKPTEQLSPSRAETELLVKGQRQLTVSGGELTGSQTIIDGNFTDETVEISHQEVYELQPKKVELWSNANI